MKDEWIFVSICYLKTIILLNHLEFIKDQVWSPKFFLIDSFSLEQLKSPSSERCRPDEGVEDVCSPQQLLGHLLCQVRWVEEVLLDLLVQEQSIFSCLSQTSVAQVDLLTHTKLSADLPHHGHQSLKSLFIVREPQLARPE